MDAIHITDLAVLCHIGVPDEERAKPQRLLISATIEGDFSQACATDDLNHTVDYFRLCQQIRHHCRDHSPKLIERLAHDLCQLILRHPHAQIATVQIKKFIIPETRHISCAIRREKARPV